MKSSSLLNLRKVIPRPSEYRDALIHNWHLTENEQHYLEVYLLTKEWATEFLAHVRDGEIYFKKKSYSVTWINSPSRIKKTGGWVTISLRYCPLLNRGYALVRCDFSDSIDDIRRIEWN